MRPAWLALALLMTTTACGREPPPLLEPGDLRPTTERPDVRVPYGPAPSQFAELWLPAGAGPHPVVVLVHGGCWNQATADLDLMDPAAADLRRRGYAVWNIEYRRLGEPGGGYPGTFQDTAAAFDALRNQAGPRALDLDRLVAVGHSAGGHLAGWAAARPGLPADSPLRAGDPLPVPAVLALGGVGDLEAALADDSVPDGCSKERYADLVDLDRRGADAFADTSPARLPAPGVRQVLLHGQREQTAPVSLAHAYAAKAAARGETVEVRLIPDAGHFEPIAPDTPAWAEVVALIEALARPPT